MEGLNFINGEFVAARGGGVLAHQDPESGENTAELADSGLLDLVGAIQAANKAAANWTKSEANERAALLEKAATLIQERAPALAEAQRRDQGTPVEIGLSSSIPRAAEWFRHHADIIRRPNEFSLASGALEFTTERHPIGVVGIITPCIDPLAMIASRTSAALAAGNAVILKASEFTPRIGRLFAELLRDSGLPAGVFNLVQGRGETAGAALVDHPGLSTLAFIGATETGRTIAKGAAENLKRLHLSLGARNPVLVFGNVDLQASIGAIADVTLGVHPMACWRGSRLFVQESIYKPFLEAYAERAKKVRLGPLPNLELARKFDASVAQAISERGKTLFGGVELARTGAHVEPTAFFDLTLCSTLQQDDVVGPFVSIASFKYQHDAVRQANNSPLGQVAYVYEGSEKAAAIAAKIEAGRVFVNVNEPRDDLRVPAGGIKLSGFGRENSDELIKFFSRDTTIASARVSR